MSILVSVLKMHLEGWKLEYGYHDWVILEDTEGNCVTSSVQERGLLNSWQASPDLAVSPFSPQNMHLSATLSKGVHSLPFSDSAHPTVECSFVFNETCSWRLWIMSTSISVSSMLCFSPLIDLLVNASASSTCRASAGPRSCLAGLCCCLHLVPGLPCLGG